MSVTGSPAASAAAEGAGGGSVRARRRRGEQRREEIIAAAAEVLARDGLSAVTHRSVAAEAGVPLAATTYYFADRTALLVLALERVAAADLATSAAFAGSVTLLRRGGRGGPVEPGELAEHLVALVAGRDEADRARALTLYEVYLQAGRDPRLREVAARWSAGLVDVVAATLAGAGYPGDRTTARMVTFLLDGLALELLVEHPADEGGGAGAALARPAGLAALTMALELLAARVSPPASS